MKNLFKYFMPIAAAAVAITACNKEGESDVPVVDPNALEITVNASLDALQGDTRTYIDDKTIRWGTGEYMKIGVFDGTTTTFGDSSDETADGWNGDAEAFFNFTITPANVASAYTYYGLYPASAAVASSNTNPANYKVKLPPIQSATATSYDPKAYILIAMPEGEKTTANADWMASFRRATALNHLTLKNISEDIKRVTITAPEGVWLAGGRYFDLTANTIDSQNIENGIYSGGGRTETVEVRFNNSLTGGADMDVWFTSWGAEIPVGQKLTIIAYSSAHTFTREITVTNKPISFKEGYLNTLSVNMSSATQGDNTELEEGNYVILADNNGTYYALKAGLDGTTRLAYESYTGSTSSYTGTSSIIWAVAMTEDGYTISNDNKYLGWNSGNSAGWNAAGDNWTATNYTMDITWSTDHYEVSVHNETSRILAKNSDSKYGFAFYTGSGYKNILFVPATVDSRTAVTLAFESATAEFTNAAGSYDQFLGYDVTATAGQTDITNDIEDALVWSKEDDDNVIDEWDNGALTLTGNTGTATVKVSFPGDQTYLPAAEVSYTITVTDATVPPAPTTGWVETALADLSSSDVFVIVGNDTYTISNAQSTSAAPAAATLASASVTISGTAPNRSLSGTIPDGVKWTLTGNGTDGYTFYSNANSSYHLYNSTTASSKNNDAMRVGNPSSGTDRKLFVLDGGNHLVTNDDYDDRYLACYTTTPDWRGYLNSSTSETTITFYKYVAAPDNREEAGMSWSSDSATATYSTGNTLGFTAPTLTAGNATGITYESTDETIATINASGTVTITALTDNNVKEGSTTIKAVFAGDTDYKPQTVSYTLTVVDNRAQVATPTFDPAAGEVSENTNVDILCETNGAAVYYTEDGSTPTTSSSTGNAVVIDAAKTIKAFAVLSGYKDSEVATAAYTIAGTQANDGSLEHPFNVDEAKAYIDNSGSDNVYVAGIVHSIVYEYDTAHGTGTFWISDDGNSDAFEAYQVYFLENKSWAQGNSQIKVGDEVILYGKLTKYNTIYETSSKNAYLYSLNGVTSETLPTITKTDITDVANTGVTDQNTTVTFANNSGWTASVTADGSIVTSASISGTTITYSVAENTGSARTGYIDVTLTNDTDNDRTVTARISVSQVAASGSSSNTPVEVTYVFNTDAGIQALGISKPSASNGTSLSTSAYVVNGVSMTATHGSTDTRVWNSNGTLDLRIYKNGGSLTFSVESGKKITSIVIAGSTVNVFNVDSGSYSSGTWSPAANSSVNSVKFTATGTGKINTIAVTYE